MPKAPILYREAFYETLADGSIRMLDFNLVNTELGAMIEPRSVSLVNTTGSITTMDVYDASINKLSPMKEDEFYRLTGFSGRQAFTNWNR